MTAPRPVVIIGGGAAGTLVAIHLASAPSEGRPILVVEPAERLGEGVAYGTTSSSHLLNVRANGMSAFPDRPAHFTEWARGHGLDSTGTAFLPRMLYARYLGETLDGSKKASDADVRHIRVRAVGLTAVGVHVSVALSDGSRIDAQELVLATGNGLAPMTWLPDVPAVIRDPWQPGALDSVPSEAHVAIVGSGLSAVDVVLSLRDRGHRGSVTMISSHGLLPETHAPGVLSPRAPVIDPGSMTSARGLVRAMRMDGVLADDWRQTIDGVRPVTVATWRALPPIERRRALRHAFRRWEVRRHRMAPEVAAVVDAWRSADRLRIVRGRVRGIRELADGLSVTVPDGEVAADVVIVCVGPSADPLHDPFLSSAVGDGILARHPLGLGLDVDELGRARRPDGTAHEHVWTVGSLRKGAEWESTAVPELRLHAAAIAGELSRGS